MKYIFIYVLLGFSTIVHCEEKFENSSILASTPWCDFCEKISINESLFKNFKRNPEYTHALEHVSYVHGLEYLEYIKNEYPKLYNKLENFRVNDTIGNPYRAYFKDSGIFSPTTLRYVKVYGDILKYFGDISNYHIVEIGGGYGGQCLITSLDSNFSCYEIIDMPQVLKLTKKYLENFSIKNFKITNPGEIEDYKSIDLLVSNYALSECYKSAQLDYFEHVIKKAKSGYLTMNFTTNLSFSKDEFIEILLSYHPNVEVIIEDPITHPGNIIAVWGLKNDNT